MSTPLIIYWSGNSGGTKRVAQALKTKTLPLNEAHDLDQPFIILFPTYDQPRGGFVPKPVENFLNEHHHNLVGVIGAGNLNFMEYYCQAAKDTSKKYGVPILHRVDIMGTEEDYRIIDDGIKQHWETLLDMKGLA